MKCGVNLGMKVDQYPGVQYKCLKDRATMDQMFRWYQTQEVDLVIFITKEKGDLIYRRFYTSCSRGVNNCVIGSSYFQLKSSVSRKLSMAS